MNGIFFFIPFLIVASIGIYEDVFALESYRGYDYSTVENPDGTVTWTGGLTPWMLNNDQYVPFVFTDGADKTVETEHGSIKLNTDGTFSFYKNGKITESELFSDRIITKYADISDLNTWTYPTSVNDATPEISWDGNELVSTKSAAIGILEYKFINNDGSWKTQLEATNLSTLETKAFGFDQIIDLNRDSIKFNGIIRNLDNLNGTTLDKEWLTENKANVVDFLNGVHFDFDLGFDNLYSVTIIDTGANKSRLIFDYRTSTALLPGETLIIDPTFISDNPTVDGFISDNSDNNTCDTASVETTGGTTLHVRLFATASSPVDCALAFLEYDISSIPVTSTVTDVSFDFEVNSVTTPRNCDYVSMGTVQPSVSSMGDIMSGILSGTDMISNDSDCTTAGSKTLDFGVIGDAQVQARIDDSSGFFSFGITPNPLTLDASEHTVFISSEEGASPPELTITYVDNSIPSPITDLIGISNVITSTIILSWTEPGSGSGNITGYQVNYTTPLGTPNTILENNTETTDLSYEVLNLQIGVPYSFSVGAWNEFGTGGLSNIWNGTLETDFQIGNLSSPDVTNTNDFKIFYERTDVNSSSTFLNVTYPNSYDLECNMSYAFARTNNTYGNLSSTVIDADDVESTFQFINATGDIVTVNCYDTITGDSSQYILTITQFPFLDQMDNIRNGTYGTYFKIGAIDGILFVVVLLSMIGLNRTSPIVGIMFVIIATITLSWFDIITYPIIMYPALALLGVWAFISTRKDD